MLDLLVSMPASCFRERDVKSFAYADKRSMYLGAMVDALHSSGLCSRIDVEALGGDVSKPVLRITAAPTAAAAALAAAGKPSEAGAASAPAAARPRSMSSGSADSAAEGAAPTDKRVLAAAKALSRVRFRLIPALPGGEAVFPASALTPAWNNVRVSALLGEPASSDAADSPATPHYTAGLAQDLAAAGASAAISAALASCPPATAALAVVKAWAHRRGLAGRSSDAFSGFHIAAIVASLVQRGLLLPRMCPLQATRAVVQYLATTHLAAPAEAAGEGTRKGAAGATAVYITAGSPVAVAAPQKASGGHKAKKSAAEEDGSDDDDEGYHTGDSAEMGGGDGDDGEGDEDSEEGSDEEGEGDNDDDAADGSGSEEEAAATPSGDAHRAPSSAAAGAPPAPVVAAHQSAYSVCILYHDAPSGLTVNLASGVSAAVARELRADAGVLLPAVSPAEPARGGAGAEAGEKDEDAASPSASASSSSSSGLSPEAAAALFERVFSEQASPAVRYDRVMVVPLPPCPLPAAKGGKPAAVSKAAASAAAAAVAPLTDLPTWADAAAQRARGLLATALTDRVASLRVVPVWPAPASGSSGTGACWPQPEPALCWPASSPVAPPTCLWVCVTLNTRAAPRNVDRGPAPEAVAASAAFTRLWGTAGDGRGGLGELRRFADGSVVHAVVWDAQKLGGRAHARDAIVPLIVAHVLNRHMLTASPAPETAAAPAGGKKGGAGKAAAAAAAEAHVSSALPVSVLHAGDHLAVAAPPASASASSSAHLLLLSDVARAVPSLALERVLDAGGCVTATAMVAPDAARGGLPAASSRLAAAPGATLPTSLPLSEVTAADALSRGPAGGFSAAAAAFDALSSALRNARGVPLRVSAVTHASPALRGTAAHAPCPHPLAAPRMGGAAAETAEPEAEGGAALASLGLSGSAGKPLQGEALLGAATLAAATAVPGGDAGAPEASQLLAPLPVVATLESSSRWPDDPDAIAALKTAFYLKLKYSLSSGADGGLPKGSVHAEARPDGLRVALGGFAFLVSLHHPRELALLERAARRGPLARPYAAPAAAANAAPAPSSGASAPSVRGFVNVAPMGLHEPEAPLTKKQRTAAAAAAGAGAGGKARFKGEAVTKPLAATEGMAVLRAQLGLGPAPTLAPSSSASSAASAGGSGGALSASDAGARLDALHLSCVAAPRHSAALGALSARFSAYGPTVRLAALWLASLGLGGEEGATAGSGTLSAPATVPPLPLALRVGSAGSSDSDSGSSDSSAVVGAYHASLAAAARAYEAGGGPALSHEALELLVAHVFTAPHPHGGPPATPAVGLLRVLRLVGRWDWERSPLLVDPDISHLAEEDEDEEEAREAQRRAGGSGRPQGPKGGGLTAAAVKRRAAAAARLVAAASDARTLASRFRAVRAGEVAVCPPSSSPTSGAHRHGPPLYVVTPSERGHWRPTWSRGGPSWPVLGRLVALARQAEAALAGALAPAIPHAQEQSGAGAFYAGGTSLLSMYAEGSSDAADPFRAFSGGAQLDGAPALPYHAVASLRPAVAARWGVDGRCFGPVKPPVALAAALWAAPASLQADAHAAAEAEAEEARERAAAAPSSSSAPSGGAPAPHLQLVAANAPRAHGAPSKAKLAGGGAGGRAGGALLVLAGGWRDPSRLTLPLHRNLLGRSRESLCVGFEPLACTLAALRASPLGSLALFFPQPPHHAAAAAAMLRAAAAGGEETVGSDAASAVVVGVVWRGDGTAAGTPALTTAGGAEPTAAALATVPLIASAAAGVVKSIAIV